MSTLSERLHLGQVEKARVPGAEFELRESRTAGNPKLDGWASLFEVPYDMYGGPEKGGWTEIVDRRALNKTLSRGPDTVLLVNHDGLPLAKTVSGTLDLDADKKGLRSLGDLEPTDPDVQRLLPKMRRGDLREMSFAFRTVAEEWNADHTVRRLMEVNIDKGDVSVVNYGAQPKTSAEIRSLKDAVEFVNSLDPDELEMELRSFQDLSVLTAAQHRLERLVALARPPRPRIKVATADPRSY